MDSRENDSEDPSHDRAGGAAPSAAALRMREAITAVTAGSGSREQVKTAAQELVAELRQRNLFPEEVLVRIKEILAEAGLHPSYASAKDPDLPASALDHAAIYRDVITWSIRCYYEGRNT